MERTEKVTMVVPAWTIGLDVGDRVCQACIMDARGEAVVRENLRTNCTALRRFFTPYPSACVVLEVGTHSPWISRLLKGLGAEVVVANPRKVRLIGQNERKSDPMDAELLARVDPQLLYAIRRRDAAAQADLARLQARDAQLRSRARLINHVRGSVKALGARGAAGGGCGRPVPCKWEGTLLKLTNRWAVLALMVGGATRGKPKSGAGKSRHTAICPSGERTADGRAKPCGGYC